MIEMHDWLDKMEREEQRLEETYTSTRLIFKEDLPPSWTSEKGDIFCQACGTQVMALMEGHPILVERSPVGLKLIFHRAFCPECEGNPILDHTPINLPYDTDISYLCAHTARLR